MVSFVYINYITDLNTLHQVVCTLGLLTDKENYLGSFHFLEQSDDCRHECVYW